MYKAVSAALLIATAMLWTACSRELTREEARSILNASDLFTPGRGRRCSWLKPPAFAEGKYAREVQEVTGIVSESTSSNGATVDFTWDWKERSADRDECLGGAYPKDAKAIFRRYDDGWRVTQVVASDEVTLRLGGS